MTYDSIVNRTGFDVIEYLCGDYIPTSEVYLETQMSKMTQEERDFIRSLTQEEFYRIAREKGYEK